MLMKGLVALLGPLRSFHSLEVKVCKSCQEAAAHFTNLSKGLGLQPLCEAVRLFTSGHISACSGLWGFGKWPQELEANQLDPDHPLVQQDNAAVAR
eukprot:11217383-Lingulodinium_polyedra.AAC.1